MRGPLLALTERQAVLTLVLAGVMQVFGFIAWLRTLGLAQIWIRSVISALVIAWLVTKLRRYRCFRFRRNLAILCEEALTSVLFAVPFAAVFIAAEQCGWFSHACVVFEVVYWVTVNTVILTALEWRLRARQHQMERDSLTAMEDSQGVAK